MNGKRRILFTGAGGYLAGLILRRLVEDPSVACLVLVDTAFHPSRFHPLIDALRETAWRRDLDFVTEPADVRDAKIGYLLEAYRLNTVYHLAWIFNPQHNRAFEMDVNVRGSENVLTCALRTGVQSFIYAGSTTAYVDKSNTGEPIPECRPIRTGTRRYVYSYTKALVDTMYQDAMGSFENFVLLRGAIVLGPHTRNIVSQMADLPFNIMPRIAGYDPPMQFCSESDMADALYLSLKLRGQHIVNIACDGVIPYSAITTFLGKRELVLPAGLLYPLAALGWHLRAVPFPPGILDLIRYPWIGDNTRMKELFASYSSLLGYSIPRHTTLDALTQFRNARSAKRVPS